MAHTPQASSSSSAASSRGDQRHQDVRAVPPRSASKAGSSSVRSIEEEAFERAAAQLRPAWASDLLPKLPEGAIGPTSAPLEVDRASERQVDGTSESDEDEEPVSGFTALPKVTPDATRHEPLQPIFAAAQSAFPAPSPAISRAPTASGETGQFIAAIARPARSVRWLAIGSAVCLLIGLVWAIASSGSDNSASKSPASSAGESSKQATPTAATKTISPVAPTASSPSKAATSAAGAVAVPRGLEMPRELPASSASPTKATSKPALETPSATAASKAGANKGSSSKAAVAKTQASSTKTSKRALAKAGTPVRTTKASKASAPVRSKSNLATPVSTKRKPAAKTADSKSTKRKRATTAVLDPWGN